MSAIGVGLGAGMSTLGVVAPTGPSTRHQDVVTETVTTTSPSLGATIFPRSLSDGVTTLDVGTRGDYGYLFAEGIDLTPLLVNARGVVVPETVSLTHSQAPGFSYVPIIAEMVQLDPTLLAGIPVVMSETVELTPALTVLRGLTILEALSIDPAIAAAALFGKTITQGLEFSDSLADFFGVDVTEALELAPALAAIKSMTPTLTEALEVTPALTPVLLIRATFSEALEMDDALTLQALFNPTLSEGIEFTIGYVGPSGSFTTWAINTRTGAVTEYDNFTFNSFARVGGRYVAASSSGLYELLGDDDAGTDIIARLRAGFVQLGGSRFTSIKTAYLGMRGAGDFVLRIETGDGTIRDYGLTSRDMRTTKVHFGKGLRTRYFSWELISEGSDFDLDTVEFVPLIAKRRV